MKKLNLYVLLSSFIFYVVKSQNFITLAGNSYTVTFGSRDSRLLFLINPPATITITGAPSQSYNGPFEGSFAFVIATNMSLSTNFQFTVFYTGVNQNYQWNQDHFYKCTGSLTYDGTTYSTASYFYDFENYGQIVNNDNITITSTTVSTGFEFYFLIGTLSITPSTNTNCPNNCPSTCPDSVCDPTSVCSDQTRNNATGCACSSNFYTFANVNPCLSTSSSPCTFCQKGPSYDGLIDRCQTCTASYHTAAPFNTLNQCNCPTGYTDTGSSCQENLNCTAIDQTHLLSASEAFGTVFSQAGITLTIVAEVDPINGNSYYLITFNNVPPSTYFEPEIPCANVGYGLKYIDSTKKSSTSQGYVLLPNYVKCNSFIDSSTPGIIISQQLLQQVGLELDEDSLTFNITIQMVIFDACSGWELVVSNLITITLTPTASFTTYVFSFTSVINPGSINICPNGCALQTFYTINVALVTQISQCALNPASPTAVYSVGDIVNFVATLTKVADNSVWYPVPSTAKVTMHFAGYTQTFPILTTFIGYTGLTCISTSFPLTLPNLLINLDQLTEGTLTVFFVFQIQFAQTQSNRMLEENEFIYTTNNILRQLDDSIPLAAEETVSIRLRIKEDVTENNAYIIFGIICFVLISVIITLVVYLIKANNKKMNKNNTKFVKMENVCVTDGIQGKNTMITNENSKNISSI